MDGSFSWPRFEQTPIIVILRGYTLTEVIQIAKICMSNDYYTLEVTMNSPDVLHIITELRKTYPSMNIGAGTVCTLQDLNNATGAGAQFIVSPISDQSVIESSKRKDIPIFPGAMTPTEIYQAWSWGANAVKVFPASTLGPKYIQDVLAPLDSMKLVPTGGVNLDNIAAYFQAGAIGVGMGGRLIPKNYVASGRWEAIENLLKEYKLALK